MAIRKTDIRRWLIETETERRREVDTVFQQAQERMKQTEIKGLIGEVVTTQNQGVVVRQAGRVTA